MPSPAPSRARRRSASPRRSGTRQSQRPLPTAGPGERLWVLDVPYGTQVDGASWHPAVKTHLYVGRALPAHLAPYAPGPFTLGRFIENTLNPGAPTPAPEPTDAFEPRRIQFEAADAIAERAAAGGRQFLLADEPGVGKTISAVPGGAAGGGPPGARRGPRGGGRPPAVTNGPRWPAITGLGGGGVGR